MNRIAALPEQEPNSKAELIAPTLQRSTLAAEAATTRIPR